MQKEFEPVDELKATVRTLEHRHSRLEQEVQRTAETVGEMASDMRLLTAEVATTNKSVSTIADAIKEIVVKDAKRGEPHNLKAVAATLAAVVALLGSLGLFTWWFIGTSPTVISYGDRLGKLDDDVTGRVPALERLARQNQSSFDALERRIWKLDDPEIGRIKRLEKDAQWAPRVVVGN